MRKVFILALGAIAAHAATFGKVTPLVGGASDIVLDEARGQLYFTASVPNQVQVYSIKQAKFLAPIATDQTPLSAALSRDGNSLYVVCYDSAALDVINLNTLTVSAQVALPAKPEGVAVDSNGLVLISTVGSANGTTNLLMLYNPSPRAAAALTSIPVTPAAPGLPTFPPSSGRPFLAKHSQLVASRDGTVIAGANAPVNGTTAGTAMLFEYQAASASVPLARIVTGNSTTLTISDDGTRIMCGPVLYDSATLQVLAQQSGTNAPYPLTSTAATFNTQTNQGGAAFGPGGLYAAWNIAPPSNTTTTPGTTPPAANVTQLLLNDPDNLLINMGIQLPENLAGRMVISSDGANAYALSDSGFIALPLSTLAQSPIAVPASRVAIVTSDPCGVTAATGTATIPVTNQGKGSFSVSAQVYTTTTTIGFGPPGGPGATTTSAAPSVRSSQSGGSPALLFSFNSAESKIRGTVSPPSDFLVTSNEAVNIPPSVRVFENSRDSEARASVLPIAVGPGSTAPLPDLAYDSPRQRVYIANTTMNRVEVYDIKSKALLTPVKVGQAPVSMALSMDGSTLYVANSGGESISIVNTATLQNTGRVALPPLPFGSNIALATPSVVAMGLSGLQFMTSDGTLWKVVGNAAVPRPASKLLGATRLTASGTQMAATPAGEYILLTTTAGVAYLYDATLDDFVTDKQVLTGTQITGYVGPVAAGPGGAYYVMNGVLLDSNLETVNGTTGSGAVSSVASASATSYAYFTPVATTSTTAPTVSLADARTGSASSQFSALEGPLTQTTAIGPGGGRTLTSGRTLAVDSTGAAAYAISVSGLSIIPLTTVPTAQKPVVSRGGAVNLASYQSAVAVNGLLSIFGSNLGSSAQAATVPLPTTLGGTCVTLNNLPLPLFLMSSGQINAQIPPNLAAGTYPLVIHSIANLAASTSQNITVSKAAPAVFVDGSGNALLYHADGSQVTTNHPATRDEPLTMYATGLGATTGGTVTTGMPSPSSPLAVVSGVQVFFGNPSYTQAAIIVDWAGLAPGLIGVYQLNLRIPGFHINGDALPITLRVGTVNSPTSGVVVPTVSVN
jgi:uncharacterized protein (TIGR03437 family)